MKILDDDGQIVDTFQLKATDSLSYINEALKRYPDIHIITTNDIAQHASDSISIADISNDEITNQVHDVISNNDSLADYLLDTTPTVIIAITEWLQVKKGKNLLGKQ